MKAPDNIWIGVNFDPKGTGLFWSIENPSRIDTSYTRTSLLSDPAYLASVDLMKVPEFCEKCGDSGIVVSSDSWEKRSKPYTTCPCTTNPNAWVNVKQTIGGKG